MIHQEEGNFKPSLEFTNSPSQKWMCLFKRTWNSWCKSHKYTANLIFNILLIKCHKGKIMYMTSFFFLLFFFLFFCCISALFLSIHFIFALLILIYLLQTPIELSFTSCKDTESFNFIDIPIFCKTKKGTTRINCTISVTFTLLSKAKEFFNEVII